jgi:hypothetical protein
MMISSHFCELTTWAFNFLFISSLSILICMLFFLLFWKHVAMWLYLFLDSTSSYWYNPLSYALAQALHLDLYQISDILIIETLPLLVMTDYHI